jgi:hypothetical protein
VAEPARLARRCATARSPGDGEQENEREVEDEWRRPCGGDAEARQGHGVARAAGTARGRGARLAPAVPLPGPAAPALEAILATLTIAWLHRSPAPGPLRNS